MNDRIVGACVLAGVLLATGCGPASGDWAVGTFSSVQFEDSRASAENGNLEKYVLDDDGYGEHIFLTGCGAYPVVEELRWEVGGEDKITLLPPKGEETIGSATTSVVIRDTGRCGERGLHEYEVERLFDGDTEGGIMSTMFKSKPCFVTASSGPCAENSECDSAVCRRVWCDEEPDRCD